MTGRRASGWAETDLDDGGLALVELATSRVVQLDSTSAAVLLAVDSAATLDELLAAVSARLGSAPDSSTAFDLIQQSLDLLHGAGLISHT